MGPPMRNCASELKAGTTSSFADEADLRTYSPHSRASFASSQPSQ
jgi:hypothetical protein